MAEWIFTINDQVREREGAEGVAAILSIIRAGAEAATRTDLTGIEVVLNESSKSHQRSIASSEVRQMASNLAVPDLTMVRVVDGSGNPLAQIPVNNEPSDVHPDERSENNHVEPENPGRPTYS